MKILEELKIKVKNLKKEITAIYYAYQHPKTTVLPKIIILFTLGYALSPIDLIPDFIPVLGYLDDLLILPVLIALSIKLIPHEIMEESRKKAENQPLQLKKNWVFAIVFIIIWIALFMFLIHSFISIFLK
ncbi:YkvA family protein [Desulfobacula sp.]|uniref:YkvA family protein n=1 Tax=Desulfobacula sp. TaxID=2593537 RepID=UPI0026340FC9|nr:YkvA family protein [Desulfobacula sp.]